MIRLTRLNRQPTVFNADLILCIESVPDTLLTLMNGERAHVLETVDQVVELALEYQQRKLGPLPERGLKDLPTASEGGL